MGSVVSQLHRKAVELVMVMVMVMVNVDLYSASSQKSLMRCARYST